MTIRRRPAKFLLLVLAIGLAGLGVWAWEPVWWWAMTEHVYYEEFFNPENGCRGVIQVKRWKRGRTGKNVDGIWHGRSVSYYVSSGLKVAEGTYRDGQVVAHTLWLPDGTVGEQLCLGEPRRVSPPWLWGVTDQTAPSAPAWILDDEQWQEALDEQQD